MLIMKYLDIGNEIYHGTLNNFDPKDINEPSWFTIEEEQSIKWIFYKYNKLNKSDNIGYIHKFEFIKIPNLINLDIETNLRLEINAYGNHKFSQKIKNGDFGNYDGYINLEDQAEIMLIEPLKFIKIVSSKNINVLMNKSLKYTKTKFGWRLI